MRNTGTEWEAPIGEPRVIHADHDTVSRVAGVVSSAPDQPQDEEQHHRADDRDDEAADAPLEIGPASGEESKQEAAQEGADDADDNVLEPALLAIRPCDHAGHPARQCPEDDPGDDAETAFHGGPCPVDRPYSALPQPTHGGRLVKVDLFRVGQQSDTSRGAVICSFRFLARTSARAADFAYVPS